MPALLANPITTITSLSGDLLITILAVLLFVEETGVPIPFAPGDLLLLIAGIAIASDTVEPIPMLVALLLAISLGAMVGREVFAAVGRATLYRIAEALRFRAALERAAHRLRRGGAPAVFIARLIPGLRIHTTQAAGVSNMPRATFAAGLVPSVVVYIAIFVGLGAVVGQRAVGLFHRTEHRFFVVAVSLLAVLAVALSIRWLARRGALAALEPMVLGIRRDAADSIEAWLFGPLPQASWRQYPIIRRAWAALIDVAVAIALAIVVLTAASGLGQAEEVFDPQGLIVLAAVWLVYRVLWEGWTGQSLGKVMMGISVYGPQGGRPQWWRAAGRNVLGMIPLFWPVDVFLVLRRPRRQRVADLVVGATVRRVAV